MNLQTDPQGNFQIPLLLAGTYDVWAEGGGTFGQLAFM